MKRFLLALAYCFYAGIAFSQVGSWTAVTALAPNNNGGGMLLLSDGTVICKSTGGGTDGVGNTYNRLTPNASGSYINGTWSSIAPMINTRLYYSSQVLKDGRVYVAGGEYGTGISSGEVYNPLTNAWTATPAPGVTISDANSEILEDGRILQAHLTGGLTGTLIYDPATNTYSTGPTALGIHNESVWIKLPDNSVLYVNRLNTSSERYIPATNTWIADANVPVQLYDAFGLETGGAELLPDGRAIFFGSSGHNAYYTPSGTTAPGTWAAAPDFPNAQGAPDAPCAMMVNGKVLCNASPIPTSANHFPTPTTFYEFDPVANTFTAITAPGGGASLNVSTYVTNFLCLPDGNILYGIQGSNRYYIYTPVGTPTASGKPTISSVTPSGSNYLISGTQFNGISQGASYGDDWQMNTNYPIVRLANGANVYYCRTFNWNSTGVRRGTAADNATFTVPATVPAGTYSLYVVANGIASNPVSFTVGAVACGDPTGLLASNITTSSATVSWNPVSGALNYTVDYKLPADVNWTSVATATTATTANITGLAASTFYIWRVRANCASASSNFIASNFTTAAVPTCATAFEPNETQATAAAIVSGATNSAAISTATDNDYYKITTTATSNIVYNLVGPAGVDFDMQILNSAGTVIGSGTGSTATETVTLNNQAAGTYTIRVFGFNGATSATCYTIKATATAVTGCASSLDNSTNGTIAGAATIPFNTNVTGLISPTGDIDHYKFVITTGGTATVTLTTLPADYDLKILNSAGTQIGISQAGGTTGETITLTYTPGTYYAQVYGFNGANNASTCYTVKVQLGTATIVNAAGVVMEQTGEVKEKGLLKVYPNPATDFVTVSVLGNTDNAALLNIVNSTGKTVGSYAVTGNLVRIPVTTLPKGVYVILLNNGTGNASVKFVKQ